MRYKQKCWAVLPRRLLSRLTQLGDAPSPWPLFASSISSCLTGGKVLKIHICTDSFSIKAKIFSQCSQGYGKSVFLMT